MIMAGSCGRRPGLGNGLRRRAGPPLPGLGLCRLGGDLARDRSPVGDHDGGLGVGGQEAGDIDGIDAPVLAQAAAGAAVGHPAGE
jgi:hypothetical protein